ncbi:MAG: cysteine peptidase family C39 domain-containing protein, partial [Acidimicrobiia bacterium]
MKRRRVPHVGQMQYADCGAACLGMVLAYHGCDVALDELRAATGTSRDGVDARAIVEAARRYGLKAHGVAADIDSLDQLPPGSVLHWEFRHFVVLERVRGDRVDVVDPVHGLRRLPMTTFRGAYTGVAIVFEPDETFQRLRIRKKGTWRYLRPVLDQTAVLARVLAASALIRLVAMALPVLTGLVVDDIAPHDDRHLLTVIGLGMAAIVGYHLLASIVRGRLLLQLRTLLDVNLT